MSARYTVSEPLGRGTRVFRGVAESTDGTRQDVVFMRLWPSLTRNEKFVGTFIADLLSSLPLKHANIVELLDLARTPEGAYFVVTEFVEGCNLKELVARRRRPATQDVIYVMVECCKALAYAHSSDLMHRDLSPRSLLLSNKGEVRVADFGFAKANSQMEDSEPGIVKGKFSYLSPEAASGVDIDHRSDVFAAGIVLWELLAGRRLFLGDTDYQTVELVRAARVVPIEGLDPALDTIVRKALARDASARYESAAELADALAQHAFSRRIKLSAAGTATLVRDVHVEIKRERAIAPMSSRIEGVQAEVRRMFSIAHDARSRKPRGWN